MTIRSAPAEGYDFGNKRQYRRTIWSRFRKHCVGRLHLAQALLMPSLEGDEIDVALNKGFREENLHVVDRNPAIVATLKRRYPKIQTYGVELERAVARMADRGVTLDVANLDLCGQVSLPLLQAVDAVAHDGAMNPGGLVAVTMLRGRESGLAGVSMAAHVRDWSTVQRNADPVLSALTLQDCWRLGKVQRALCAGDLWDAGIVATGRYKSVAGSQTMIWGVYQLMPGPWQRRSEFAPAVRTLAQ